MALSEAERAQTADVIELAVETLREFGVEVDLRPVEAGARWPTRQEVVEAAQRIGWYPAEPYFIPSLPA